ncbi:MAG: thiolase family protein [Oligoflexia bacterium]|nr:thiolase family protein [Oligoflexia bacterium]
MCNTSSSISPVYILSSTRTAIGSYLGKLSNIPATTLGAQVIGDALKKANVDHKEVDEVIMGQVLQAGVGQAPARQAAIFAKLPSSTTCTTVNKVCGSGLKSIIMGAQAIKLNEANVVVAGGMENMSLSPHFIPNSRGGMKFGNVEIKDTMQWDGLWDVYSNRTMGSCAEECVKRYSLSRSAQDEFAINSFKKAQQAIKDGVFANEISATTILDKKGNIIVNEDEGPFKANFEKIPALKAAFEKDGTITAANASTINDGAAVLVLSGETSNAKAKAKFKIRSYASHAEDPTWFTIAPIGAINKSLRLANLNLSDIGLFEINEAFACVTMSAIRELKLDESKVNIFGGAVALGHPIGASGARIVVTLMNAMERKGVQFGLAAICIGGGEALSMIIERI